LKNLGFTGFQRKPTWKV